MTGAQLALSSYLVLGLPLVAALAWWLKHRYTAAVVRLQGARRAPGPPPGDAACPTQAAERANTRQTAELQVRITRASEIILPADSADRFAASTRLRRRVLLVHAAGELAFWCALMLLMIFAVTGQVALVVLRMLAPVLLAWAVVPVAVAWMLQTGLPRRLMTVAAAAVVIYAVSLLWSDAEGWQSEAGFTVGFAAITLLVSAFLRPTIRGAGLPLVAASIAGWAVFSALFAVVVSLEGPDDGASASIGEIAAAIGALLALFAASVWCGWRALMALTARYAAKRFSDIQLALAVYWVVLTAFMMASLLSEPANFGARPVRIEWITLAVVWLWLLWRWLLATALRAVIRTADRSIGALLLLRVFKPSGRSQAFTERFFAYWRFAAPVWMIGGPDLAGAYMEPNEFFAYLRGHMREQFVAHPGEARQRVETLDRSRDPDGRFRVTEVYCTGETWQPTVLEMMARAGVILLDLREYSRERSGTRYELTEVLRRAPLHKVLVLVGANDDVTGLRAEIESIWREVGSSRPETSLLLTLPVLQLRKSNTSEIQGLFRAAVRAAAWPA